MRFLLCRNDKRTLCKLLRLSRGKMIGVNSTKTRIGLAELWDCLRGRIKITIMWSNIYHYCLYIIPTISVLVLPTNHFLNIFQQYLILQLQYQNHNLNLERDNHPNYKFFQVLNYTFSISQQMRY